MKKNQIPSIPQSPNPNNNFDKMIAYGELYSDLFMRTFISFFLVVMVIYPLFHWIGIPSIISLIIVIILSVVSAPLFSKLTWGSKLFKKYLEMIRLK